ncbi:MAG: type I restriction-modification system specificity subunit, type I restriction enzyme, S subunit [Candidatus Peregrinibacteria bacterium GW2011_GWE2_39_6]|nr:MAG: type I restriction-modification system specificity subunit, type I restriction enzyme, S subunit [Candidatus Peregrinibacteria bacterium GW2011_GWF2_39_17]KKR25589.1 MAG: type I restriction-modification system specificity subunit, type I restriction enzyme, S subunit [Candidatus Peregrinibacteria bacterium GW2011_GWE2_39_6]HCW31982.1 hypothetical protein [Candidatus Peregrinibacteria bacterium]
MTKTAQQIPAGWKKKGLTEIARIRKGLTYKSVDYGDEKNGLVFVTLKCISKGGGFNKDGVKFYKGKYDQSNVVESGDLIIANTDLTRAGDIIGAPLFMPHLSSNSVLISMDLSVIDIDGNQVIKHYLYYYLLQDSVRQFMRSISSGSTVLHLQLKSLSSLDISLPSLPEQTRIASIFSRVDEEIEKVEQIIEQTEKLKKGLMQKLLTKGIGHTKFKQTELGEIPEEWEVEELSKVCRFKNGKAHEKQIAENGNYIVINSKFISSDGAVVKYSNDNLKPLSAGDIVMVMSDVPNGKALGKCFLVLEDNKYTLNQRICALRPINGNPKFYFYVLSRNSYFLNFDNGVGQTNLRKDEVLKCFVPVPPVTEQEQIAKILDAIDGRLVINEKTKSNLLKLKKGLMNDLLSGKVRVNN